MLENNEKLVTWPSYGRVVTLNVKKLTAKSIAVLATHFPHAPGGSLIFSYLTLRSVQEPAQNSIFGTQTEYHILEIYAVVPDSNVAEKRVRWAAQVKADTQAEDADNILESSYISFGSIDDVGANIRPCWLSKESMMPIMYLNTLFRDYCQQTCRE
jgi:hypothetical protein